MRASILFLVCALACQEAAEEPAAEPAYDVTIRTTSFGVPHILADDELSAGVGVGYAMARDHLCTLADQFVKINSERARYHGPGDNDRYVDSDFLWLALQVVDKAEATFPELSQTQRDAMRGFAAGYNRFLADTASADLDPRCRGADWLTPIDEIDLWAYYLSLGQFSSGSPLASLITSAQPPRPANRGGAQTVPPPPLSVLDWFEQPPLGSNGWAIGEARSANGRGALLSNTHFPSQAQLQWLENHVTIPGTLNVYGASLLGSVLPNLGFNDQVAWTHTVSSTPRFVMYQLDLDPEDPTRYVRDGELVDMERTTYRIEVLGEGGSLEPRRRTMYRSHLGPIVNAPVVGWTVQFAFTYRDVNADNLNLLATWEAMGRATDLASFEAAHRDYLGIPWVHTMMADREGNALYLDSAATPNLSDEAEDAYRAFRAKSFLASTLAGSGIWLVDGSDPVYAWVDDPDAPVPGAIPYDEVPRLLRRDFVNNANMNYWLSNPLEPLEGYADIYGPTRQPLRPRTKMNNRFLLEGDDASGPDDLFTLEEIEAAALSARAAVAEDLLAQVQTACEGATTVTVTVEGTPQDVDLTEACGVLAAWDGTSRLDSVGAHVWRELLLLADRPPEDLTDQGTLYADAFDPDDPIFTPRALNGDTVLQDLGRAVVTLDQAEVELDAALGDIQYYVKGGERYPRLGGQYLEGLIAIADYDGPPDSVLPFEAAPPTVNSRSKLQEGGYQVNTGNSWVMAVSFTDEGPDARAVMVYGQSEDPESPHFADQAEVYAESRMRPVLFDEEDILADPALQTLRLRATSLAD